MSKIATPLAFFLLFLIYNPPIYANSHIVINEFVPNVASGEKEWVEFYNLGSDDQTLSGWFLEERTRSDLSGNASHSLESITVPVGGFAVYTFETNKLNDSGDVLTLKNGQDQIDQVSYGKAQNPQIDTPDKNQSVGRKTDGSSEWVIFTSSTKGSSNNSGQILPEPSQPLNPSPKVDKVLPKTSTTTKAPNPQPKTTTSSTKNTQSLSQPKDSSSVLGKTIKDSTLSASPKIELPASPSPSASPSAEVSSHQRAKIAAMLTGSGAILIGLSVAFYWWYQNKRTQNHSGTKDEDKS